MAKGRPRRRGGKGLRVTHGNVVGRERTIVYVCDRCMTWHKPRRKSDLPAFCHCGHGSFTRFDSATEATRYGELLNWQRDSSEPIRDIRLQRKFPLAVVGPDGLHHVIGHYVVDFDYEEWKTWNTPGLEGGEWVRVYEDVKGDYDTHMSAWKRKHAEVQYGITIQVVQPRQ